MKINNLGICGAVVFLGITSAFAAQEEQDNSKIDKAIEIIKIACAAGEKLTLEASGNGGINFIKKGVSGDFSFSKEEINGVVKGTNQSIRLEENSSIRECMQQYVPKILDVLLDNPDNPKVLPKNDYYYLNNQRIAVGQEISVLDGSPLLTVVEVYEFQRKKMVKVVVNIPYREQYEFTLSKKNSSWLKKTPGQFEYRDVVYRVSVSHIDLQEQNVMLSLIK